MARTTTNKRHSRP